MITDKKKHNLLFGILFVFATVSLLLFLGISLFNTKGEPREAVVALSMLQSGDWISPVNNGVDIAYKPPFFHWCIAICSLLTGKVTEFTARFPSALFAIIMVVGGYLYMLKNKVDCRLAFLSGIITLTAFEFHRDGMACRVDMVLSALMVTGLYAFHRWFVDRKIYQAFIAILAMSGAFLTKGPIGGVLPCMVMGVYMLVRGERFFKSFFTCLLFFLMSGILPFCWYYAAYLERGDTFLYLVYEENVLRFTGKMVYSSHEEPAIYNVLTMLAGFLPYTLLLLFSLFVLKYRKPKTDFLKLKAITTLWNRIRNLSNQDLLALLGAVLIFVFYCIPKSKRSVYLLPVYPFTAYFIAKYLVWLASKHIKIVRGYGWMLAVLAILLPVLLFVIKLGAIPHTLFHGKHASVNISYLVSLEGVSFTFPLIVALLAIAGAVWYFVKSGRGNAYRQTYSLGLLVFSIYLTLDGVVLPRIFDVKSDYYVAQEMAQLVPSSEKIWDYRSDWNPDDRNRMHQFSVNFYLGDRIVPLDLNRPKAGYLIMGDDDTDAFLKAYPEYSLSEIKRFNHRSCDDKRILTLYSFNIKK